jgi:hypothetical protein
VEPFSPEAARARDLRRARWKIAIAAGGGAAALAIVWVGLGRLLGPLALGVGALVGAVAMRPTEALEDDTLPRFAAIAAFTACLLATGIALGSLRTLTVHVPRAGFEDLDGASGGLFSIHLLIVFALLGPPGVAWALAGNALRRSRALEEIASLPPPPPPRRLPPGRPGALRMACDACGELVDADTLVRHGGERVCEACREE